MTNTKLSFVLLIVGVSLQIFTISCATQKIYETESLKNLIQTELTKIGEEKARIQVDLDEKTAALKSLESQNRIKDPSVINDLRTTLQEMKALEKTINKKNEEIVDISSTFASLTYGKNEIGIRDPHHEATEKLMKNFEESIEDINKDFKYYSEESNGFASVINQHSLFKSYDVFDIDQRIGEALSNINKSFYKLKGTYEQRVNRYQLLNKSKKLSVELDTSLRSTLKNMEGQVKQLSSQSLALSQTRKKFLDAFQGRERILSTDKDFALFEKLKAEYEQSAYRLEQVEKQFTESSQEFNHLSKMAN